MKKERWVVSAKRADFQAIADRFGIDPVIARLIRNRDVTGEKEIEEYLFGDLEQLHDPLLMKDMERAADLIAEKIREKKPIRIIGDYDIDGVTATYILLTGLKDLGADADVRIPDRIADGYGLNEHLVQFAADEGRDTIVTCDNGIAAGSQIRLAKELGMTVVVTDHHEVPFEEDENGERRYILPPADAVVNPKHADLISVQAMLKDAGFKVPEINMEAYMKVRSMIQEFMDDFLGLYISPKNRLMNSLLIAPGLPGGMMGSLMADLETNLESINKYKAKRNLPFMTQDELLIKLFNEVAYVWPRVGYPPLVTPFSQYVKNLAMMNVMAMEKGKERWGMIADDIWDMILGKAGRLPGKLAPEIIEKAEREGRKFFDGNPQDNYPDQLEKYRKMMLEKQWDKGQDDEELFEYAMHPAQYEAYKSGKAKEDFLADVKKRREEKANATTPVEAENKTKVLTVDVNGQPYRVTVAYGAVDPATLTAPSGAVPAQAAPAPVGEGKDVLSPLEGKFFLVKNAQETPKKVGEKVNKGDVICYVEAMKTYNAIRAEYDGTITAICANSGDTVSEDDVLMKIV